MSLLPPDGRKQPRSGAPAFGPNSNSGWYHEKAETESRRRESGSVSVFSYEKTLDKELIVLTEQRTEDREGGSLLRRWQI